MTFSCVTDPARPQSLRGQHDWPIFINESCIPDAGHAFSSQMARYLRLFKSERLLRYLLVVPIFLIATFQSIQIFYFTYDLFITHYGNPIRLAYHDWVGGILSTNSLERYLEMTSADMLCTCASGWSRNRL